MLEAKAPVYALQGPAEAIFRCGNDEVLLPHSLR